MPDLSPLPPLGDAPRFAPDPYRFERTARVARRRRAVRTSLPAGAAAVAVVAAFVTTGATSSNSLRPVTSPSATASGSPAASPEPSEKPSPTESPDPGTTARPGGAPATPTAEPGGGPKPTSNPTATPEPTSEPSRPPRQIVYATQQPIEGRPYPPYHQARLEHVAMGTAACGGTYGGTASPWCARYLGPRTVQAGERYDFAFELCRPTGDNALTYADAGELLWAFTDDGGERVADSGGWSSDPSAKAHQIKVAGGTCARWTASWTVPGGIRAGMYDLEWMNGWSEVQMVSPDQRTVTVQSAP